MVSGIRYPKLHPFFFNSLQATFPKAAAVWISRNIIIWIDTNLPIALDKQEALNLPKAEDQDATKNLKANIPLEKDRVANPAAQQKALTEKAPSKTRFLVETDDQTSPSGQLSVHWYSRQYQNYHRWRPGSQVSLVMLNASFSRLITIIS